MSIGAIASIVNTATAASRQEPGADHRQNHPESSAPGGSEGVGQPEIASSQDATVTTLSDAARAQQEAEESLRAAAADALAALQDHAVRQQEAVEEVAAAAAQHLDVSFLYAINAEIHTAFGGLPSPLTGDPVLREPAQVDVVA